MGNLTLNEERKLQEAWSCILQLSGVGDEEQAKKPKPKATITKELNGMSPDAFRQCLWDLILGDNPDATLLRFLRARKWDVEKAMIMFASNIYWRYDRGIDEFVRKGESVAFKESASADEKSFIMQYRSGKSYVRGSDKENRPIFIIRARLHNPRAQSPASMESFILHGVETTRSLIGGDVDKVCLIFDLTGFSLSNMDYHVVKFLVQVFEARYPETLGVVLIHSAPFVFWGSLYPLLSSIFFFFLPCFSC